MSRVVKNAASTKVNIFKQIVDDAARRGITPTRSVESVEWFRNYIRKNVYGVQNPFSHAETKAVRFWPKMGKMYAFQYQAATAADLPYWDAMPLTIFFREDSEHYWGFNFHYIPIKFRVAILGKLYELLGDRFLDKNARLLLTYQYLQRMAVSRFLNPAVKCYRKDHVRSRFLEIPPQNWQIAIFLPLAKFQKASQQRVWADYRKKIGVSR